MKVLVVSEFYPSSRDPVLGMWAHLQAVAARDAGAEVEVVVLHRVVPPRASLRDRTALRELGARLRQPAREVRDGIPVSFVRFVSPPREQGYASWGRWAAPPLRLALRSRDFDLVHAHNAVPAGDAVRRAGVRAPLVVSVHGGDVLFTDSRVPGGADAVRTGLSAARLVLANSAGIATLARAAGAGETRVLHLGTDVPAREEIEAGRADPPADAGALGYTIGGRARRRSRMRLVTVGHLVARKRHADVMRALWVLRDRHPDLGYLVIGDGPERPRLEALASELGVDVDFRGQLPHTEALAEARRCSLFVMPSVDEAFGVAYVEAMAAGIPAIGATGEPGPTEIGDGLVLVAPADVEALAATIDDLLSEPTYLRELGERARATVRARFTWEACGRATVAAYEDALR